MASQGSARPSAVFPDADVTRILGFVIGGPPNRTFLLALQFLREGFPVRAFVRRQDQRAERLRQAGAEIFVGDQLDMCDFTG